MVAVPMSDRTICTDSVGYQPSNTITPTNVRVAGSVTHVLTGLEAGARGQQTLTQEVRPPD